MKKLNTKNCCFLCLQSNKILEDQNKYSESAFQPNRKNQNLLRCLVRYLRIHLNGVGADSSTSKIQSQVDTDVEVDLCEDCAQLNSRFSKLFLQLEKIQMEMNFYLEGIHRRILESSKNAELVQIYSKEMTSDRESLTQLAFVDKLRKEIADKSSRLTGINPRVYLTKAELVKIINVKQEAEEIEDFDEINHFEDHNSDMCSPTEDSPEQLDIDLSLEMKPEVSSEAQKGKRRVPSKEVKCYSRNLSTGRYHCIICRKDFKHSNKARVHHDAVHLKKTFPCDGCSMSFSRQHNLTRHKRTCKGEAFVRSKWKNIYYTQNKVTGLLQCTKCDKQGSRYFTIVDHYETIHLKKRYKCDICNLKEFTLSRYLRYHKKKCSATPENRLIQEAERFRFICKLCGKGFPTTAKLEFHKRKVHRNAERYARDACEEKFKSLLNLKMEDSPSDVDLSSELKPEVVTNVQKGKGNVTSKPLNLKYYTKNPTSGHYHCISCNKPFRIPSTVQLHYKAVHLGVQKFKCDICNAATFSHKVSLRKHKTFCNGETPVKVGKRNAYFTQDEVTGMFQCTKCKKQDQSMSSIAAHFESIHLQKRYKCDICNLEKYVYVASLNAHKKTCRETLEERLRKKKEAENFACLCKLCGKRFPTDWQLNQHEKHNHLNIGSYACDFCDKNFKTMQALRIHRDKAHFGKRFECQFCRKNCYNIFVQKRHERDCPRKNEVKFKHSVNNEGEV